MKCLTVLYKLSAYLIIFIISISCNDEDLTLTCLPLSLASFGEDIRYGYDDLGKLTSISYSSQGGSFARRIIVISYINGRLSAAIDKAVDPDGTEILLNKYDLEYAGDKPSKLLVGLDPDTRTITEFSYDAKGRLVLRTREFGSMITKTRYEYNDKDNVVKVFYTSPGTTVEVLGAENVSFDDKARFYAGSKELGILNVFAFGYEPSKNNKLQSTISWDNPFIQSITPRTEIYMLEYNDGGLIIANSTTAFTSEFTFFRLQYTCD